MISFVAVLHVSLILTTTSSAPMIGYLLYSFLVIKNGFCKSVIYSARFGINCTATIGTNVW